MLVIVEGPDCARKSTLVDELRVWMERERPRHRVTVLNAGPPTRHPLDEYVAPLLAHRPESRDVVICDRWHLGERVYPAVLERSTQLDDAVYAYVEQFLRSRGALLVVVTPPLDELLECLARRGDPLVDARQLAAAREGFVEAAARTTLPLFWLKDESVTGQLVFDVTQHATLAEGAAASARLGNFVTYVGPCAPRTLLLGDVRKTGAEPGDLRPAFMPYPATSGHYLFSVLAGDPRLADVGVANACDVDDVDHLLAVFDSRDVVALGRNAQRRLASLRYPKRRALVRHAPHPQYWRRFHHHDRAEYRDVVLGGTRWS